MYWDGEKEEERIELYQRGLGDREIGELSDPVTSAASVCSWRKNRELPPNIIRNGKLFRKSKSGGVKKSEEFLAVAPKVRKMGVKQRRQGIAQKIEEDIIQSLPSKDDVYQKVRNSPRGRITTEQLIKERYGDVGHTRRDTVHKLRELEKEGLIELDTDSKKGQIIWRA